MAKHKVDVGSAGDVPPVGHPVQPGSTGPRHAATGRRGTGRAVGVVLAAVVVAVLAAAVVVISLNSPPDRAAADSPSAPVGPVIAQTTPAPTRFSTVIPMSSAQTVGKAAVPVPNSTMTSVPSGALLPALQESAPGNSRPGILLLASPAADGSFEITERVRLVSPVTALNLRPAPVAGAGQLFASATAAATEIRITAGDQPVVIPGAIVDGPVTVPVPLSDQFEMHYRLIDVTVRSTPSTTGRGLAVIGPLTGGVDPELPVLFIVSGGPVLALTCPLLPFAEQSCGSRVQAGTGLQRELPWQLALGSVQLNLPAG